MALQKLQNADAFVVRDLDAEAPAIGIVRSAKKILQGGAKDLARSQTYQCAVLEMQYQGASCGVNAEPDARDQALEAFNAELLADAEAGSLMLDPAKGVTPAQLAGLTAADTRSDVRLRDIDGVGNADHLNGVGAVSAASAVRSLDGASVAIENLDAAGLAVARAAAGSGAKITAISTTAGAAINAEGFDVASLAAALATEGPDFVKTLSDEELPFWRVLGAEADLLFAGSKMGLIDHKNAPNVKASAIVPTGPIPYTTKAALMLERQGVTVLPDFVTTAGRMLAGFPTNGDGQDELEASVLDTVKTLTSSVLNKEASPILEACYQAEAFLKTWREELPFGRPFAA